MAAMNTRISVRFLRMKRATALQKPMLKSLFKLRGLFQRAKVVFPIDAAKNLL